MTFYGARAVNFASFVCREGSAEPYRVRRVPPAPSARPSSGGTLQSLPRTETAARRADALARSLSGARDRLAVPLARIAASLVRERAWCAFGFARAADFVLEQFGRSGRWLRDLAALHQALSTFDGLAAALTGDDGGPPLGRRRTLLIARVATAETLPAWLALARRLTVRELQAAVARAHSTGEVTPPDDGAPVAPPESASDTEAVDLEDSEDRSF